jgi:hypothetical protein
VDGADVGTEPARQNKYLRGAAKAFSPAAKVSSSRITHL